MFFFLVASAQAETLSSYTLWQQGGFTRTYTASSSSSKSSTSSSTTYSSVSSLLAAASSSSSSDATTSLSGVVYVDADGDGARDTSDWGVIGATIALYVTSTNKLVATTTTSNTGAYSFTDLDSGTYTVKITTDCSDPGSPSIGTLTDADGVVVTTGTGTVSGTDSIVSITLGENYTGVNYDFAENSYPTALLSKRMLLNSTPGTYHTSSSSTVTTVPEPGTLAMLVLVGLSMVMTLRRRIAG